MAVAVDNGEGCAIDALAHARIFNIGAANALDVLIQTDFEGDVAVLIRVGGRYR